MSFFKASVLFLRLTAAFLSAASAEINEAAPRPAAEGWSIAGAIRAVALRRPDLSLPSWVSAAELRGLPAHAPIWTEVAEEIVQTEGIIPPGSRHRPERIIQQALHQIGSHAEQRLSTGFRPAFLEPVTSEELARFAPLAAVIPSGARARLAKALAAQRISADASLASAGRFCLALAASTVDPGVVVEQFGVQSTKRLIRTIDGRNGYNANINCGGRLRPYELPNTGYPASRVIVPGNDALSAIIAADNPLLAAVDDVRRRQGDVVWTDIAGGLGVVLRKWSVDGLGPDVLRILVDLFDWQALDPLNLKIATREEGSDIFSDRHRPELKLADVTSVRFAPSERPNLMTSVQSIRYWRDKLRGFANLYNQLRDGGLLMISDYRWARDIRTRDSPQAPGWRASPPLPPEAHTDTLFEEVIEALVGANVELGAFVPTDLDHAGGSLLYPVDYAHTILIRKKPGTRLIQRVRLHGVEVDSSGDVTSYYEKRHGGRAPIEVVERKPSSRN